MKASDNPFPSLLVEETAAPANPPAGHQRLFVDPADHVLKLIDSTGAISAIGSGGGGALTGSDDFNRSDRLLAGDNGWFESDPSPGMVATLAIVGNKVVVPAGAGTKFGNVPILRPRLDSNPDVADVSVTLTRVDTTGVTSVVCVSDMHYRSALAIDIDGSATAPGLEIITEGAGGPSAWDTTDSAWTAWTATPTTVRMTYDNTTKLLSVYQDGTLRNTVDVQAALNTYFAPTPPTFSDLLLMPYGGFVSNADVGKESFENWVCA